MYRISAERPAVSKLISSVYTDDYESALRIYEGANKRSKAFPDPVIISLYLEDGTLHKRNTVNAEVAK